MQRRIYRSYTHMVRNLVDQINSGEVKLWHFDNEGLEFDPESFFYSQFDDWMRGILFGMPPGEVTIYRTNINGTVEDWMMVGQERYAPLAAIASGKWKHTLKFDDLVVPLDILHSSEKEFDFALSVRRGLGRGAANVLAYRVGTYKSLTTNGIMIVGDDPEEYLKWISLSEQMRGRMHDNLLKARKERTP